MIMNRVTTKIPTADRATLVYDSACPVCSAAMAWVRENEADGAFEMVPCQSETLQSRFPGISRDACMQAMQLVLPGGAVLSGEEAFPELLARLRRHRYRTMGVLVHVPGFSMASRVLYRWFAAHRYRIAELLVRSRRVERGAAPHEHAKATNDGRT